MEEQQHVFPSMPLLGPRAHATVFGVGVIGTTIIDVAARGGGLGFVVGGAAAALVASQSNKFLAPFSSSPVLARLNRSVSQQQFGPNGERTWGQRLMGFHSPLEIVESIAQPKLSEEEVARLREVKESFEEERKELSPIFPVYPEWQTLRLGQSIDKESQAQLRDAYTESLKTGKRVNVSVPGHRFDPHFNSLFGKGVIAAANQGFGKSMLNGVLIEQAGKNGVPTVVMDHKGEYVGVKEMPFMNAWIAGACDTYAAKVDFVLTAENAGEFVEQVMQHRYQAIINLPSYGSSWVERAKIVAAVGKALMDYAQEQLKAGGILLPCLVIVDEAQLYFPQDRSYLPAEARKNQEVLDGLSSSYFSLVSNGRSNGYTMCFSTQSLTYVAKSLIKSCQIRLLGRHCEKNDLDMCEEIISRSIATRQDMETLPPGVFVVFGFTEKAMVVQFDTKQSRDLSETPGIERLRAPRQEKRSAQPVQQLPDLSEFLEEDDMPITFEELCDAVFEMAMARESDSEIMRQLDLTREEYINIATYIKTHRSEFMSGAPTSAPTSKASSVATSNSTSRQSSKIDVMNAREARSEEGRSSIEVGKSSEAEAPGNFELTEREIRMGTMFFVERVGINVIMKEFFPGVTGGDKYQKASVEINDALRKYVEAKRGE